MQIIQAEAFIQPGEDFFPHGLAFLDEDFEGAVLGETELRIAVERTGRRAVEHLAFGEARLESGLLGLARAPSARIVEQTLAGLDTFVGPAPAADDITLLALRYSRRS